MLAVIPYVIASILIILAIAVPIFFFVIPKIKNSKWLNTYIKDVENEPSFKSKTSEVTIKGIDSAKKDLKTEAEAREQSAKQQQKSADSINKYLKQ